MMAFDQQVTDRGEKIEIMHTTTRPSPHRSDERLHMGRTLDPSGEYIIVHSHVIGGERQYWVHNRIGNHATPEQLTARWELEMERDRS